MKYYIIAGEASGDLHGSNLIKALKKEDAQADFRVWGGDLMQVAGGNLVKHYRDLAFMGFVEVAANLRTILKNIKFCKADLTDYQPDVLILIDYPGFNLRIADWAHEQGIRIFYYISPQIWAWHTSRVHQIKKVVEQMFVILPFEKDFYEKYDYQANYFGHPLLDVVETHPMNAAFKTQYGLSDAPIIALLPGSRKQEINRMLKEMLQMVALFPNYQFVIAAAPSLPLEDYQKILEEQGFLTHKDLKIIHNQTYDLLQHATAALVTSGTATLETALFNVPQVVCYKANALSYQIGKRLVDLEYISLVNLIADKKVVEELIQGDLNPQKLEQSLRSVLTHPEPMKEAYQLIKAKLGNAGASERVAQAMYGYLTN